MNEKEKLTQKEMKKKPYQKPEIKMESKLKKVFLDCGQNPGQPGECDDVPHS